MARPKYLDQRKNHKNKDSTKQERAKKVEIIASPCSPEGVQG